MKEISLQNSSAKAIINDEDEILVSNYNWNIHRNGKLAYAVSYTNGKTIRMHQLIIQSNSMIDHKDGNGLNNQRHNLRPCICRQNQWNSEKRLKTSSKFKGVSFVKQQLKWKAAIRYKQTYHYLGIFKNETDAAIAYNNAAIKYFGEFARLNILN
jgi:hypothetical protein